MLVGVFSLAALALFGVLGYFYYQDMQLAPEKVLATNVTDSGATYTWYTSDDTIGKVKVKEVGGSWLGETFYDDRDVEQDLDTGEYVLKEAGAQERNTHHVSIRGLEPEKEYEVVIAGRITNVDKDESGAELVNITTPEVNENLTTPDPAYGKVQFEGEMDEVDAIVLASVLHKTKADVIGDQISTSLSADGTYAIDLNHYRALFAEYNQEGFDLKITILLPNGTVATELFETDDYKPLDTILVRNTDVASKLSSPLISQVKAYGVSECNVDYPGKTYSCSCGTVSWCDLVYAYGQSCPAICDALGQSGTGEIDETSYDDTTSDIVASQTSQEGDSSSATPSDDRECRTSCSECAGLPCHSCGDGRTYCVGISVTGNQACDGACGGGASSDTSDYPQWIQDDWVSDSDSTSDSNNQGGVDWDQYADQISQLEEWQQGVTQQYVAINTDVSSDNQDSSTCSSNGRNYVVDCTYNWNVSAENTSGQLTYDEYKISKLPNSGECSFTVSSKSVSYSEEALDKVNEKRGAETCSSDNSSMIMPELVLSASAASDSLTADESGNYVVYSGDDFEQPIAEFAVNLDGADRAEIRLFVDENGNGKKDAGEKVLDDYTQIQLRKESEVATYNLFAGWNLVTVPLISDEGVDTASKLLKHFNDQGADVKHVAKYTSSGFEMYTKRENDQEYSNDFNIVPGQGYFLLNYSAAKVKISGHKFDQSVPFRVRNGWNLVGIYTNEREYTAEDLLKEMSSEGIQADTLSKYDGGQYTSVIFEDDVVYGNDYNIFERAGYFLRVVSGGGEDVKFTPID